MPRVTYYARVNEKSTPENPWSLLRRVHTEPRHTDEVFQRDLQWHPTEDLHRDWLGLEDDHYVEITEAQAEAVMQRWRDIVEGQQQAQ